MGILRVNLDCDGINDQQLQQQTNNLKSGKSTRNKDKTSSSSNSRGVSCVPALVAGCGNRKLSDHINRGVPGNQASGVSFAHGADGGGCQLEDNHLLDYDDNDLGL